MASIPIVLYAVMIASAAYTGYTTHQTTKFNEKMANQEADYQRQVGDVKGQRQRRAMRKAIGEQGVAAAGAGVSLLSGSILDAFTESTKEGAFDAIMIRNGAKNAERGALIKASEADFANKANIIGTGLNIGTSVVSVKAKFDGTKVKK